MIYTYDNSIGNINNPHYEYWRTNFDQVGENTNHGMPNVMIYLIWSVWFLNQWLVLIILLNFIIAIISQSFEQVMSKSLINMFAQRTQMNQECQMVMRELNLQYKMDLIILTANTKEDNDVNTEW